MGVRRRTPNLIVTVLVLVSAVGGCAADDGGTEVGAGPAASVEGTLPSEADPTPSVDHQTREEACGDTPTDTHCGVSERELRDLNLSHADRHDFLGDPADAATTVGIVRHLLAPFVGAEHQPTPEQFGEALEELGSVQTASNAVRTAGTAFAVEVPGGCVFGQIYEGELFVEIGGYVNDGGCLAVYGH